MRCRGPGAGGLLQITSPVSAGSSGGPLIDTKGQVVGRSSGSLTEGQNLNSQSRLQNNSKAESAGSLATSVDFQ